MGEPLEDLAWTEWMIRTYHPELVGQLSALFSGYGAKPAWKERHAAMIDKCRQGLEYARGRGDASLTALWQKRLAATMQYDECTPD